MAGPTARKRSHQDLPPKTKGQHRPSKKQKRKGQEYHSDSEEDTANPEFQPVNLLDSDNEDLDNAIVDDISSASDSDSNSISSADSQSRAASSTSLKPRRNPKPAKTKTGARDAPSDDEDEAEDDEPDTDSDSDASTSGVPSKKPKSKRNDPEAFATSISKILSTKLSTNRRADPVLSRSVEAHKAAKDVVDSALEAKARKHLREQKRLASEKGRVRDVLVGPTDTTTGEPESTTGDVLQTERRLRKTAHRGVVKLFRAFREAQERAIEAERDARKDGVVGIASRDEKVNEMSRQGFLDLIAGGGGKLKKGGLEEA